MNDSLRGCSGLAGGLAAGMALLLLGACAAGGDTASAPSETSAQVFSVGYADVERVYIDDVKIDDLALAGVEGLSQIDPGISIERQGKSVQLAVRGETAGLYDAPSSQDVTGWGKLTDSAIRTLVGASPAIAKAGSERIYESVFDAVAKNLDQYSRYASRSEAQENRANRDGFGGVGIRIDVVAEGVMVQQVMHDTPAERSGLEDGDLIVAINGLAAAGIEQSEAVRRLRGPVDSEVVLTVDREGHKGLTITVIRDFIVPQTVTWRRQGDVLILRVEGFNHDTTRALQMAIVEAEEAADKPFVGMVLDLRGNPGGLLDQSVSVSDLFLDHGTIVTTHGRHPDSHQVFNAQPHNVLRGLPMVVLVNGYSASASEIVAAALQDNQRALVVGTVSYGKGSVQTLLRLPNDGELTLTWARFHAPSGYPLSGRGVLPDICSSGAASATEVLLSARNQRSQPSTQRSIIDEKNLAALASFRNRCPPERQETALDVDIAVRLLQDQHLYRQLMSRNVASLAH